MIREADGIFLLETQKTAYLFRLLPTGHLQHVYYGKKLELGLDAVGAEPAQQAALLAAAVEAMAPARANANGCSVVYDKEYPTLTMNDLLQEVSGTGTGDFRSPMVELTFADGTSTVDFVYEKAEVLSGASTRVTLPCAYDETGAAQTLKLVLQEKCRTVALELYYTVFEDCDVITRSCTLVNRGEDSIGVKRLFSAQLDIPGKNYVLTHFHGDWAREMERSDTPVCAGRVVSASRTGFSSNHANPFVMLFAPGATEYSGEGWGCNLIWSGPHLECAEVSSQGDTRLLTGISPEQFCWRLDAGERLEAPEAVLTFSDTGYSGVSRHMHAFVQKHIVRGTWKKKERPVLLNSWEASYFNFSEASLLKLARAGRDVGVELFVLDDGWFGVRNDDKRSLGDWYVNKKKLPGGIRRLAEKVEAMGMKFGIWVEPEMVNEDSDLYRAHPDWAVRIDGRPHAEGRNQMLLDLTRSEVCEYLITAMSAVFSSGPISYVKWDMNRNFSDIYSHALPVQRQGEFLYRYQQGLYRVMSTLAQRFPHILFEGCASGGNRFDLGILCSMPQIWASDDSDAIARCSIQNGLSYGYPQSVIGAHVSNCPNHQTLRTTPLETRFAVAAMGVLGYECNLAELKKEELEAIKEQIALYKQWRRVLQFGQLYRVGGRLTGAAGTAALPETGDLVQWCIVSPDKRKAVAVTVQETVRPHTSRSTLRLHGLKDAARYHLTNRSLKYDIRRFGDLVNMISPVHIKKDSLLHNTVAHFIKMDGETEDRIVTGALLNHAGVALAQGFAGTGYGGNTRLYQDFDARMYFVEEV